MYVDKKVGRNFVRVFAERALLICHGLPYDPGSVVEKGYSELARFFARRGHASVIFDFAGTGLSDGIFSILAWVEDVVNLAEQFERVMILGYSMGGAVAVRAAAELNNVEKLAVVAAPCSVEMFDENVLKMIYTNAKLKNLLKGIGDYESFKRRFAREFEEIEPKNWIGGIKIPKLIVHGKKDDIVPFENGVMLFENAAEPKTFIEVEKGDHFLRQDQRVSEVIADWFEGKIRERKLTI